MILTTAPARPSHTATRNACTLCAPLGASIAFKGIAGAVPLLHGSQGCSTYIRRYVIGHFREPIDIASSSFSEKTTIFGGEDNLRSAIMNIVNQYGPSLIGIATTCLAETIGENVSLYLSKIERENQSLPPIVPVSTPSYRGTHIDGYRNTVKALVNRFACEGNRNKTVTIFPGMLSPADLRHLQTLCADFSLPVIVVPDYSLTLDGGIWDHYKKIPEGGTTIKELGATGSSSAAIELGMHADASCSAAALLKTKFGIPDFHMGLPIGIESNDRFFELLSKLSGYPIPEKHVTTRQRLVDAMVDGHKFIAGKRVAVYGDEDFVTAVSFFAAEIGMQVTIIASGTSKTTIEKAWAGQSIQKKTPLILGDADFEECADAINDARPDMLIGSSKGFYCTRKLGIPLVRIGFPIHDRIGAQRLLHIGYEGTLGLFDRIVNTMIERNQTASDIGYMTW